MGVMPRHTGGTITAHRLVIRPLTLTTVHLYLMDFRLVLLGLTLCTPTGTTKE